MWAAPPDGTDLRLCRLAMVGLGLVWRGRLLRSVEGLPGGEEGKECGDGGALQLAVQPEALQAWLGHPRHEAAVDAAAASTPVVVVRGVEFCCGVADAVLALQLWVWRQLQEECGRGTAVRERVCCLHLNEASCQDGPSCGWLASCQLSSHQEHAEELPGHLGTLGDSLRQAPVSGQFWRAKRAAELRLLIPRWLHLGALFSE